MHNTRTVKEKGYLYPTNTFSDTIQFPSEVINCPLNVTIDYINQSFQQIVENLKFGIMEIEERYTTAIHKKRCSLKYLFSFCFSRFKNDTITAVKMEIELDEIKCLRRITIKGLYGVRVILIIRIWNI